MAEEYNKEVHYKITELREAIRELNDWYEEEHDKRVALEEKLRIATKKIKSFDAYVMRDEKLKIAVDALVKLHEKCPVDPTLYTTDALLLLGIVNEQGDFTNDFINESR